MNRRRSRSSPCPWCTRAVLNLTHPTCSQSAWRHQTISDEDAALGDFHYLFIPSPDIFWSWKQRWQYVRRPWSSLQSRSLFEARACEFCASVGGSRETLKQRRREEGRQSLQLAPVLRLSELVGLLLSGVSVPYEGREGQGLRRFHYCVHCVA